MQDILLYGFSTFLPSILKSMKYNTLLSNYLTIPIYIWGAIKFLCVAWASDRYSIRGPMLLFANIFGVTGYILLRIVKFNGVKYFATYLCAVAVYVGPGINVTWLNVNIAPHHRRAAAIGFQQSMGNTAGAVAGQIYRVAPYKLGNLFSFEAFCVSQVLTAVNIWYAKRENVVKEEIAAGRVFDERKVKTGDREVEFMYHVSYLRLWLKSTQEMDGKVLSV